jgi:hypothetical protein
VPCEVSRGYATPFQNLNGNKIIGNNIGRNNLLGDPIGLARPVKAHRTCGTPAS